MSMDLESRALARFDKLVANGELLWADTPPQYFSSTHFHFQFRAAASLNKRPMTAGQKRVDNAFSDEDPDFNLGTIGPKHRLILNKYCVVRPQFVLHTTNFESQDDPLNVADLQAAWHVLSDLQSEYIAIFNCGVDAGASVGHKHMQIVPFPDPKDHELFPETKLSENGVFELPEAPFKHAIQKLPTIVDGEKLFDIYQHLRRYSGLKPETPHNMIMLQRWMMTIPRTIASIGELSANALTMIGMVWMKSEEHFRLWTEQDPALLLQRFGVARELVEEMQ